MYSELPPIERVNGNLIRLSPNQRKRVRTLIRGECCNYSDSLCVVLDCECVQSNSYSLYCKWFRRAVLSQDKPLFAEIIGRGNFKLCTICGAAFVPKSNRGKYCDKCAKAMRRKKKAEYERRRRQKVDI